MLPLLCAAFLLAMLAADLSPTLEALAVVGLLLAVCATVASGLKCFVRWVRR